MGLIQPQHVTLTIGNAITSPNSTTDFLTALNAVGTNEIEFSAISKEFEIKTPERSTSEVKMLGATSGIQNSFLDYDAPTKAEFTATILASPEELKDADFLQFTLTASATKPTSWTARYNFASAVPTAGVAVVVQTAPGTGNNKQNWLLNNAIVETIGGIKLDADGYAEQEIKVSCAAQDCWVEHYLNYS